MQVKPVSSPPSLVDLRKKNHASYIGIYGSQEKAKSPGRPFFMRQEHFSTITPRFLFAPHEALNIPFIIRSVFLILCLVISLARRASDWSRFRKSKGVTSLGCLYYSSNCMNVKPFLRNDIENMREGGRAARAADIWLEKPCRRLKREKINLDPDQTLSLFHSPSLGERINKFRFHLLSLSPSFSLWPENVGTSQKTKQPRFMCHLVP